MNVPPGSGDAEGRIAATIHWDGRTISRVDVRSARPLSAVRLLEGRPAPDAVALAGRLFAVCGRAQRVAAAAAVDAAIGVAEPGSFDAVRELALAIESAREHLWHLLLRLPSLLGRAADEVSLRPFARAGARFERALEATDSAHRTSWPREIAQQAIVVADEVAGLLEHRILGPVTSEVALAQSIGDLRALTDAGGGLASGWVAAVRGCGAGGDAGSPVRTFTLPDVRDLVDRFAARIAADDTYAARPTLDGEAAETGAWARRVELESVATPGTVEHRLLARLAELARLVPEIRGLAAGQQRRSRCVNSPVRDGIGIAAVDTARGVLIHQAGVDQGIVRAYRIVAPTEWTFHPRGALARGLTGITVASEDAALHSATLYALMLDPCVPFHAEVRRA
ncbi:MAG: hypothetical protein U1F51_15135 [Burkholderiales bacterium]